MIEKPKIQYIGQFYIHGSAAQALAPEKETKKPKTRLPLFRPSRIQEIQVEPVAIVSLLLAVVLLVSMAVGFVQLQKAWNQYDYMYARMVDLQKENAQLRQTYRETYDLEAVRAKAIGMGMVPVESVPTMMMLVTVPEPEPEVERSWTQEIAAFWQGLWA